MEIRPGTKSFNPLTGIRSFLTQTKIALSIIDDRTMRFNPLTGIRSFLTQDFNPT